MTSGLTRRLASAALTLLAPTLLALLAFTGGARAEPVTPHGSVGFSPGDLYTTLKPGRYVAGLVLADGYSLLARTSFRVR